MCKLLNRFVFAAASGALLCIGFSVFPLAANAATIGITVNGTCEAGSCPPVAVPIGPSQTLPIDFSVTLADGDTYLINGSFTDTNQGVLAGGVNHLFQVTYEGNVTGGASSADSITVQAYYALQTTESSELIFRNVLGAFGPTIAASSSATSCLIGGTQGCVGTITPPGAFNNDSSSFVFDPTNGVFLFNPYFTSNFGAGSPVGSYIVWGQTTAIPAPSPSAPEPATVGLAVLGLGGILVGRNVRRAASLQGASKRRA